MMGCEGAAHQAGRYPLAARIKAAIAARALAGCSGIETALELDMKMSQALFLFSPQLPFKSFAAHPFLHRWQKGGVLAEHQAKTGVFADQETFGLRPHGTGHLDPRR